MPLPSPRVPLFQRKGPPSGPGKKPAITIAISHGDAPASSNDAAGPGSVRGSADDGASGDPGNASDTCPNCGCMFDPATGEVTGQAPVGKGSPDGGASAQADGGGVGGVGGSAAGDPLANLFAQKGA